MDYHPVVIIAFKEFDNLGVGYLDSVLSRDGYETLIIDFRNGREEILKEIYALNPLIIGFSVIFQYYIYAFRELVCYLREQGVSSHFSAGGQYASMRYKDLFRIIPSLDSVVRFEGEYTFLELVNKIHNGTDWHKIKGIAYKENGGIIVNDLRPPEMDLDKFPFPKRGILKDYALNVKFATILAGRGCINNCSFCNNTEYIKQSSAAFKRVRKPEKVVDEISFLYDTEECSVFLFEDDDFPVKTNKGSFWIEALCKELKLKRLSDKIIWGINCRSDEIDYEAFALMKDHGLYQVFIGIDDGTDSGLMRLNKHMTVAESLRGINILKRLAIGFDYGFMLFQPSTTFKSINQNLEFLRHLCSDGTTPVTFLKLVPYFDTRIEWELRQEGRLKGNPGSLDYDFLNNSLNNYYSFIRDSFMQWLNDSDGVANVSKWSRNYLSVFSHFYKMTSEVQNLSIEIRRSVAQSNAYILDTMKELAGIFETGGYDSGNLKGLTEYRKDIRLKHDFYREKIAAPVKKICRIAEYQKLMKMIKN